MIHVENLQKSYTGSRALDGLNLDVRAGELFGLVGPNGAGKTTLMKILSTLLKPDGGRATVDGVDVQKQKRSIKSIVGYMPDSPGIYQEMRVREYLDFFADAFRLKGNRRGEAVEQGLIRAGLVQRSEAFVEELSLGMRQRLLLAKTLLHGPKLLLLDEPATGLDPIARIQLREQLRQLQAEGVTIFISSHILSDLEDICTRVAMIANGKNAADSAGNSIIELRQATAARRYRVKVEGNAEEAATKVRAINTATLVNQTGQELLVELTAEDSGTADLLRQLVQSGIAVIEFSPAGRGLEQQYREAFGGGRQ
jgi:ABC-2 type transport system ATP-binding protein